MFRFTRC